MEEKPITQNNSEENLKTVKTYMSDMAETVRQNEISVIKVALAEQNKHEREDLYRKIEGTTSKKVFWVICGVIIILGALYGAYYLLSQKKVKDAPVKVAKEETIISYDNSSEIMIDQTNNLKKSINDLKQSAKSSTDGNIGYIKIYENDDGVRNIIDIETLFSKLNLTASASLVRSLSNSYMVGTYAKSFSDIPNDPNSKPKLFIILESDDYEYSYAGMFDWEKTMASDLIPVFTGEENSSINNDSKKWKDVIISNRDARVLVDETGKPILYYLFIDKNRLIITESIDTIKEVSNRLMIKNMKPM